MTIFLRLDHYLMVLCFSRHVMMILSLKCEWIKTSIFFLVDHLKIVHVACIFVDFRIADDFPVEIYLLTCADQRGRICTVTQSC
jgi:hypothetical protein